MREWTREERYRVLQSPDEIRDLYDRTRQSVYRQLYHVQPITGLSSDPNGFALHRGVWHLCYQWCPWGAVHGLKYWYHVTSRDLIHWENAGIGLRPDCVYDNRGTHSGSAISREDELVFFYTGNHRDENWVRTPYTCAAVLGEDGRPKKLPEPLFGPRDDYSEHQRDPKVVCNPQKRKYYIFIGAQTKDLRGCVLVYESEDLLSGWRFSGQLKVPGYEQFGGMWECPYIVNISGSDVLIFSPQYTTLPGRGPGTNHNVYLIGKMDYDTSPLPLSYGGRGLGGQPEPAQGTADQGRETDPGADPGCRRPSGGGTAAGRQPASRLRDRYRAYRRRPGTEAVHRAGRDRRAALPVQRGDADLYRGQVRDGPAVQPAGGRGTQFHAGIAAAGTADLH